MMETEMWKFDLFNVFSPCLSLPTKLVISLHIAYSAHSLNIKNGPFVECFIQDMIAISGALHARLFWVIDKSLTFSQRYREHTELISC